MGFSIIGLTAVPGEAGFFPTAAPAILSTGLISLIRAYGAVVAYSGWKRGVDPNEKSLFAPKKMAGELLKGAKETAKGLFVENRKKALTYRNCLLLVLFGVFSSFMEGLFNMRVGYISSTSNTAYCMTNLASSINRLSTGAGLTLACNGLPSLDCS